MKERCVNELLLAEFSHHLQKEALPSDCAYMVLRTWPEVRRIAAQSL